MGQLEEPPEAVEPIGRITPAEAGATYYSHLIVVDEAETQENGASINPRRFTGGPCEVERVWTIALSRQWT